MTTRYTTQATSSVGTSGQVPVSNGTDAVWTTLNGFPVELQIANGVSSILVGEFEIGGHPFDPARWARTGCTTVITLEVAAAITNPVGVTGTFRLYDGGGVLRSTLTWAGAPGVLGSTQSIAVALPVAATTYTATMAVVGGDGLLDTMTVTSAALVISHT